MTKIDVEQIKKITPAGWVVLAVGAVLVLAILGLIVRFAWPRLVGIDRLPPMSEAAEIVLTPTSANRAPSGTPKPNHPIGTPPPGWGMQTDITGEEYLAPSPEDEAAIREAFGAILALLAAEDAPDEVAMGYEWAAIVARADELVAPEVVDLYRERRIFALTDLAPENPVRCENYETCTAMRVKMGSNGLVAYDEELCMTSQGVSSISPDHTRCVFREFTDQSPYQVYIATVKLQEDGIWRVTNLQIEDISPPPSP